MLCIGLRRNSQNTGLVLPKAPRVPAYDVIGCTFPSCGSSEYGKTADVTGGKTTHTHKNEETKGTRKFTNPKSEVTGLPNPSDVTLK